MPSPGNPESGRLDRLRYRGRKALGLGGAPDFLVLGGMKCASTAFYFDLCQHPDVRAARRKEVHYFSLRYERGLSWYRANFPSPLPRKRRRSWRTGEASPYYLFHPAVPGRVRETVPDVKLIALLRDPIERAYSHYQHARRAGWEDRPFEEALALEPERLAGAADRLRDDPAARCHAFRFQSYQARGVYADQLEAWWAHFPREQLLVLSTERYRRDPASEMARALEFLGLRAWSGHGRQRRNVGGYGEPMSMRARDHLAAFFEPHDRRLETLLGEQLAWLTP